MPQVSRWFVHAALVYLGLGFTVGALLLWNKGRPIDPVITRFLPAHVEFLLVGWTIQLVMGVATWIFPRFGVGTSPHGSETASWAALALLNLGVWLVAIGPLCAGSLSATLPLVGRLAELGAAATFATNVWTRVRASGLSAM